MSLEVILFDLDNTLILFDESRYFRLYVELTARIFSDLIPMDEFHSKLMNSTQSLIENMGRKTNEEFFKEVFQKEFGDKRDAIWSRFQDFYSGPFDELREIVSVPPGIPAAVLKLKKMGKKIVAASNPFLPLDIQVKRLNWAGLKSEDFDLITHLGNMSYCKPQLEYYRQICDLMEASPEECLMAGNDPVNDMIAKKAGMLTYLTTDSEDVDGSGLVMSRKIRSLTSDEICEPGFKGPVSKVPEVVEALLRKRT
ncbi:HAD family hydrolase [Acidobacteriota bacterium]